MPYPPEGITIKGKVTDETLKEGVPGANVTVKGYKHRSYYRFRRQLYNRRSKQKVGVEYLLYRVCNPRNSSGRQEIYHSHLERRLAEPW